MTDQRQGDGPPPLKPRDEIDELFGRANPNPDRIGCPGRDVLIALARKQRPIGDPAYEHLAKCSPCYHEVRSIQEADRRRRRQQLVWAASAAVILVAAGITWMLLAGPGRRGAGGTELRAQLDLRPYALTRGAQRSQLPPLSLPSGRTSVTILLPTGSEPGKYEVQVLDSQLASKASTVGDATLRDHVTTLQTTLALDGIAPGSYQLAVRRNAEEWQLFPMQVH